MTRKLRNPEASFKRSEVATTVLPVLVGAGEPVPFPPNIAIGGCTCFRCGNRRILVRTTDTQAADLVMVAGEHVGRQAQRVVDPGTEIRIGERVGQIALLPVQVTTNRIPGQRRTTFVG